MGRGTPNAATEPSAFVPRAILPCNRQAVWLRQTSYPRPRIAGTANGRYALPASSIRENSSNMRGTTMTAEQLPVDDGIQTELRDRVKRFLVCSISRACAGWKCRCSKTPSFLTDAFPAFTSVNWQSPWRTSSKFSPARFTCGPSRYSTRLNALSSRPAEAASRMTRKRGESRT